MNNNGSNKKASVNVEMDTPLRALWSGGLDWKRKEDDTFAGYFY